MMETVEGSDTVTRAANSLVRSAFRTKLPDADIEQIVDEELAGWEESLGPILKPVIKAAEDADDFDSFLAMLDEIMADAEDRGLIVSLAKAMAKGRINGLADG